MKKVLVVVAAFSLLSLSACITEDTPTSVSSVVDDFPTMTPVPDEPEGDIVATSQQQSVPSLIPSVTPASNTGGVTVSTNTPPATFTPPGGGGSGDGGGSAPTQSGPTATRTTAPPARRTPPPPPNYNVPTSTVRFPTPTPLPATLAPPTGPTLSPDTSGFRSELTGDEVSARGQIVYSGTRCLLSAVQPSCGCRPEVATVTFAFPDSNKMEQTTKPRTPEDPTTIIIYSRVGFNAWQASVRSEQGLDLVFTVEFRPNGFDQQVDATYPGGALVSCVNRWNR